MRMTESLSQKKMSREGNWGDLTEGRQGFQRIIYSRMILLHKLKYFSFHFNRKERSRTGRKRDEEKRQTKNS